jgi:hypothetical protein
MTKTSGKEVFIRIQSKRGIKNIERIELMKKYKA